MNDRFKFRVFISDKKNSKNSLTGMFKVHSLHTGTNKAIISSLYGNVSIKLENNILMQCTGLKDKNGKLIYEGDIIAFMNPYENDKLMAITVNWKSTPIVTGFNFGEEYAKGVEVIGNIYENPELLKECENE